jgi:hypothetical protein
MPSRLKRSQIVRRKTLPRSQRPVPAAGWCTFSNRCPRAGVVLVGDDRLCKTHARKTADDLMSAYIRSRDRTCRRCGVSDRLQHAHLISRGARFIRYEPENGIALCAGCHYYFTLGPARWNVWLEENMPGRLALLARLEAVRERSGYTIDLAAVIQALRERGSP